MRSRKTLIGLALGLALGCCDSGPVRNPADAALRCGQRPEHENNCNACTSQPACGWCEQPQTGQTRCQAASDTPTGCSGEFRRSPNECAAPQEAPPGAVE